VKEWFGLLFSRNALVFCILILVGAGMWFMRSDIPSVKDIVSFLIGIVLGYFTGKFAADQPGEQQKG
jgi:hypothetical protein